MDTENPDRVTPEDVATWFDVPADRVADLPSPTFDQIEQADADRRSREVEETACRALEKINACPDPYLSLQDDEEGRNIAARLLPGAKLEADLLGIGDPPAD